MIKGRLYAEVSMETFESIAKSVGGDSRKEILDTIIHALIYCPYPKGCNPECPFYKDYQDTGEEEMAPLSYCQAIMAGRLIYVRSTLEDKA